jgi:hypothetical protein
MRQQLLMPGVLVRFALILLVTTMPWLPVLCQQTGALPTLPASLDRAFSGPEPDLSSNYGLVYVPLDSWVYPAFERLFSLGYADSAYLGMRPWTRTSCLQILQETYPNIQDAPQDEEAPWQRNLELIQGRRRRRLNFPMSTPGVCTSKAGRSMTPSTSGKR